MLFSTRDMLLGLIAFGIASCAPEVPTQPFERHPLPPASTPPATTTTFLTPRMDTYVRQGSPNQNQGSDSSAIIQSSGKNRILIQFATNEIQGALSDRRLVRATLVFRIKSNGENWGTQGRQVDVHTLTIPWDENASTWNCAVDANPANSSENCGGSTKWNMDGAGARPWDSIQVASTTILGSTTDSVVFDLTSSVAGIAATGVNQGWIVKKNEEGLAGKLTVYTRESGYLPRLVLESAPSIPSGLVAFYPLDGNGNDASVNGNNGVVSGATPAIGHTGAANTAMRFADSDVITAPSSTALQNLTSEMTLVFWVRRDVEDIVETMIPVARREFGNRIHFEAYAQAGGFGMQCCSPGGSETGMFYAPNGSDLTTINDGQWHQVALVRKFGFGGSTTLYLDGVVEPGTYTSGDATAAPDSFEADLMIGHQPSESPGQFHGLLDNVYIFNRALDVAEIQGLP